jgi:hypothetical protein
MAIFDQFIKKGAEQGKRILSSLRPNRGDITTTGVPVREQIKAAGGARAAGLAARQNARATREPGIGSLAAYYFARQPRALKAAEILGAGGLGLAGVSRLQGEPLPEQEPLSFADMYGLGPATAQPQQNQDFFIPEGYQQLTPSAQSESLLDNLANAYGLNKEDTARLKADWWAQQLRTEAAIQASRQEQAYESQLTIRQNLIDAYLQDPASFANDQLEFQSFLQNPADVESLRQAGINTFVDYLQYKYIGG